MYEEYLSWLEQEAQEMLDYLNDLNANPEQNKSLMSMVRGRLNGILACKEKFEEMIYSKI